MSTLARALSVTAIATAALVSSRAAADDANERARDAYAQGARFHKMGDYARAADAFARADEIVPSAVALSAALEAAVLADAPVLGMELVERAQQRPRDAGLVKRAETARSRFAPRVATLNVSCERAASCLAMVDGVAVGTGRDKWILAGQHTIVTQVDDDTQQRIIDIVPGDTAKIVFSPKPPPAPPAPVGSPPPASTMPAPPVAPPPTVETPPSRGLHPAVFFVAAGLTLVGGGVTTAFALDTRAKRDDFRAKGCESERLPGCITLATDGTNARDRTNVALAATGALGVTSIVLGAFFIDWRGGARRSAAGLAVGPGRVAVAGEF